ncbi:MAG: phytoene desaturase family protein [Trueperaceae bacterium]|nr:phytoene desaturase family protein [Trueperaceae bacterium]
MSRAFVLGGGFAGLSAAIHLAAKGRDVTLVEQQDDLGGKAGEVTVDGYRFDTGPSVFTLPEVLAELFAVAGREVPVGLEPLTPLCRYVYPSGRVWDVYNDVDKTTAPLSDTDARAYRALLAEAKKLYEAAAPTFLFGPAPGLLDLARYGLRYGLQAHPTRTLPQLIDRFSASEELKRFFLRFATYFGADPYRAPAVLHNIAWVELGKGVYYPKGGIKAVVNALHSLACELGVEVRTGVRVTGFDQQGRRVRTVKTDQDDIDVAADDVVVSSLDVVRTHTLLGRRTKLEGLEPSLSGFVLLLGLEGTTDSLAHHNIFFPDDYPAEFADVRAGRLPHDPTLYLSISSRSNPSDAPPGHENWFVLANAPAFRPSEQLSPDQEAAYAEHLIDRLEARGLNVRPRLRVQRVLPPRHLATLAHRGSIYGVAPHSLTQTIRPSQTVRGLNNLVLAGGSVHPGGGIPLALLSGRHAADLVT